jgi:ABC-type phosphate transport system substrate-binding protein
VELIARRRAAAAAFVLMAASAAAQEPPRVIVNSANSATQIQRSALLAIYMGEMTTWSDGKVIAPVDHSMRSPVRAAFSEKVLGKPAMSVQIHWLRKIAAEHVNPPPAKPSDAEVVAYVRANPGAIGWPVLLPRSVILAWRIIDLARRTPRSRPP